MVPQTQSAKTPVAGTPTTVVRKPVAGIPTFGCPSVAAPPPCHPHGLSMVRVCLIRPRNFVAGPTQMRQMRHIADTKNAFSATTSVSSVPFLDTISAHAVIHSETKPGHHVSPHTPPCILIPAQADPIQRRHKCHRHQLRKRKNRELCVSPLTKAKLTRSCAGPNPGAITYIQFTTDIALKKPRDAKD